MLRRPSSLSSENHYYWPPMNTDERGFFDSLAEQVLDAGFLEKVYERDFFDSL